MAEGELTKQENKVYFLAGYIYAQAESIARDSNLAEPQVREEANIIWKTIVNNLLKEGLK